MPCADQFLLENAAAPTVPSADEVADRTLRDFAHRKDYPQQALKAVLEAHRVLGLTLGAEIAERRNQDDPLQNAVVDRALYQTLLHAYQEIASILIEHVQKLHENHRAHYSPEQRFRILQVKSLLGWTQSETASCFDVASNTIGRWEIETKAHPERETIGSLIKPHPPVRRFADVVRYLVQTMALSGFGGNERIARTLARAGWKLASETVRRIRKEKSSAPPEAPVALKPRLFMTARHPNHVTMADLTDVPALFRLWSFKLGVFFDVFSRFPLAARVFTREPSGSEIAHLFQQTVQRFGPPKYFVSDRGSQFTSESFLKTIQHGHVSHRFGALGKVGAIALIERLWRTTRPFSAFVSFRLSPTGSRTSRRACSLLLRVSSPASGSRRRHPRRGVFHAPTGSPSGYLSAPRPSPRRSRSRSLSDRLYRPRTIPPGLAPERQRRVGTSHLRTSSKHPGTPFIIAEPTARDTTVTSILPGFASSVARVTVLSPPTSAINSHWGSTRKYMLPRDSGPRNRSSQTWATFVRNHAHAVVASDFLTVVTARFQVLFVLVIMEVECRRILHLNVTPHPTRVWVSQQFREALPFEHPYRFVVLDRDILFSPEVRKTIEHLSVEVLQTPPRAPKTNAFCERLVGTLRRECLDFLIPLSEKHLRRALFRFRDFCKRGRPHASLGPGVPEPSDGVPASLAEQRHRLPENARIVSVPISGGLHHDYRLVRDAA